MAVEQSEILKEAVETLLADAELTALLGGAGRIFNHVPQDFAEPYVVVSWQADLDWDTKDSLGYDGTLSHEAVTIHHGDRDVLDITDRIRELYAETPLALTSGRIVCFDYLAGTVAIQVLETHRAIASFNVLVDADGIGGAPIAPVGHADSHLLNGVDELNGDQVGVDYVPSNYTPDASVPTAGDAKHLAAHLGGIDDGLVLNALIFGG